MPCPFNEAHNKVLDVRGDDAVDLLRQPKFSYPVRHALEGLVEWAVCDSNGQLACVFVTSKGALDEIRDEKHK